MKRAVLDINNIEKCIENGVYAAPISPSSLSFSLGEKVYVAMRVVDAKKIGVPEYIYMFVMGKYMGENETLASKIYGSKNRRWKHFWKITKIESISPFSLKELVHKYSGNKDNFYKRYRGENLVNKTVTNIGRKDGIVFINNTKLLEIKPSGYIEEDFYNFQVESYSSEAEDLSSSDLIKQIKNRDKKNRNLAQRLERQEKLVRTYKRDPKMGGLLQNLYKNKCQVCGGTFIIPSTKKYYSEHHHIIPVSEEGTNEYKNIIVVCSTCHKKFERNYLKIDTEKKKIFYFSERERRYKETRLKHDMHLLVNEIVKI